MEINRKPSDATRAPADRFTGDVWMWGRIGATKHTEVRTARKPTRAGGDGLA